MNIAKFCLALFIFVYLLIQSKSDMRTGYVVKSYNDFVLGLSFVLSFSYLAFLNQIQIYVFEIIGVCIALFVLSSDISPKVLKIMQKADAKAFGSIYFCSGIIYGYENSLKFFCLVVFVANLTFMTYYHVIKKEKIKMVSEVHKPYFPFITIGYFVCSVVYFYFTRL